MRTSLAVAVGAALGASARWRIGASLVSEGFPWATLLVNVAGCAVIGWVAIGFTRRTVAWYFVVTGCLGGFTTASTFAVETRQLLADGRVATAVAYVTASVGLGLGAVSASRTAAQRRSTS